jgi:ADP-ribosylglycohydrolase
MTTPMTSDVKTTALYDHALGCMLGGLIGDAIGTPTEGMDYPDITAKYGWVADFDCDGTDDTVMKVLLTRALVRTDGYATLDDWAAVWLDNWQDIFSSKMAKFFISVLHTAQKLRRHATPRMAALGNMPSSSSAMCISPVGIVNACNPRMAALQTYNLASLIHVQDVGFCQDGAVAMATAVAEAFRPGATVRSVVEASTAYILPASGAEMLTAIDAALSLARETGSFDAFREAAYKRADSMFCRITCDSRETVPITLALFVLADGDVEKCVTYGANFGRDADTIASMAGAIAGALNGVGGIKSEWVEKANRLSGSISVRLAEGLVEAAIRKAESESASAEQLRAIAR